MQLTTAARLGATPLGSELIEFGGVVDFRVWAPLADAVAIRLESGLHALTETEEGTWSAELPARPGDDYRFVLDGRSEWPDPCSRWQPEGVRGPSRILDRRSFEIADGPSVRLDDLVVYELHVGTFSAEGTFAGVIPRLAQLRELGVTAIELMPVATFPGNRGWGYDGLYVYAPHPAYGGPAGLARLVDAAHREGLAVLLDVVYNHVGPGNEALRAFGPYFTDRFGETPWGEAIDYGRGGVREWALQNAELWVRDYRVDGLRLDAVHAVEDDSPEHVLAELAERVRAVAPAALVVSEMGQADLRPLHEWGHDAMWLDNLHHALHVALTGEQDGYYAEFDGTMAQIAREFERPEGPQLVVCAQNHDQVGNRAVGDRLSRDQLRVAQAVVLFSPFTPLLFQGEEYGESRPFQYFTDHIDPYIADATREGRRREFAGFGGFAAADVPDPQAPETFERSKLDPRPADPLVARLLRLRRELPRELGVSFDEEARTLELRRGRARLRVDFRSLEVDLTE
ncbi:MAG: malto-oligosyltrehalose trehalohydrolase [Actinobacteria bacterium]|nr:malto-oligosyltrehalose trehalohydrolase [Actinomycetota bacterium]